MGLVRYDLAKFFHKESDLDPEWCQMLVIPGLGRQRQKNDIKGETSLVYGVSSFIPQATEENSVFIST